jgi:hypothetical protein
MMILSSVFFVTCARSYNTMVYYTQALTLRSVSLDLSFRVLSMVLTMILMIGTQRMSMTTPRTNAGPRIIHSSVVTIVIRQDNSTHSALQALHHRDSKYRLPVLWQSLLPLLNVARMASPLFVDTYMPRFCAMAPTTPAATKVIAYIMDCRKMDSPGSLCSTMSVQTRAK